MVWWICMWAVASAAEDFDCSEQKVTLTPRLRQITIGLAHTKIEGTLISELLSTLTSLASHCLDPTKISAISLQAGCAPTEYSPVASDEETLAAARALLVRMESEMKLGRRQQREAVEKLSVVLRARPEVGCFADCENDFIEMYAKLKTLLLAPFTHIDEVLSDLLLVVLQTGTLIQHCVPFF